MAYKHLVFDLDDTLLDTWGRLVPQAAAEACAAMIRAGLAADLESALLERRRFIGEHPRGNVYSHLVDTFGTHDGANPGEIASAGSRAFHQREVERDIDLIQGARAQLGLLVARYTLSLVTSGHPETQMLKVRYLEIEPFFKRIVCVDPNRGETKSQAFTRIMSEEGGSASDFMSIGNRIDTDIAEAKLLGWSTCWVRYGEYAHLGPASLHETPDFQIEHITELSKKCRL